VLREFDAPSEPTQFAYAPVTNRVAIGNRSVVTVLDLKEGGIVATIGDESATSIGQFVFSPKGDILVIDAARRIEAWDLDAVAKLYELPGGIPSRTEFAFSHTGHLLLTSAQDNTRKSVTVVIYEVASGVAARKFVIPESGRSAELFAPRVAKVVTLNSPRPVQLPLRGKAFQFRIWDISSQDIHAAPFPIWNGRWVCAATVDGALLLTSDDSVTVWPTPRDILRSGTSSQSFTDRELEDLWIGLADEPSAALSAIYSLAQGGDDVVGFLHRKLPPAPPLDRSIIRKQIQALDSDRFVERQSAKAELMKIRVEAEPYLRAAETDAANLEIRRSIQEILRSPPDVLGKNQDEITAIRAIHVLELIGSTRAKELLKHVAGGAALHRRTEYAKRSIDWLESVDPR
jgi:hypothetical protein